MAYIFMNDFVGKYSIFGPDMFLHDDVHLHDRDGYDIIDDAISLYGCLLGLVKKINKYQILARFEHSPFGNYKNKESKYSDFRDGILAWGAFIKHYDKMGNKEVYLASLNNTIHKAYKHHPEGIIGWIQEKEQAYAEIEEITDASLPDSMKTTSVLHQLGNHGSEWWRGQRWDIGMGGFH